MGAIRGLKTLASLCMLVVLSGACQSQNEEEPHLLWVPNQIHSSPIYPLSMVEQACGSYTETIELITAYGSDNKHVPGLQQFEVENRWEGSTKVVSVDNFGAKGDGHTDDTEAFMNAWNEACLSAPSVFLVPEEKKYLVRPIKFSGPCQSALSVQVSGTILAPEDPSDWEGLDSHMWLHFHGIDDLTAKGGGIIDGRGHKWWAQSCKVNKTNPCRSAPAAVTFELSSNLTVRNLIVENSPQMHMIFRNCVGVEADYLEVTAPEHSPNTDGIHISASKSVVVKNSIIKTGDDCISTVSGSSNILIKNVTCGPGHGISIGSLGKNNSKAQVLNVMVDGASLHDTTNGLRIKTWQGGSGFAKRITFQNVQMDNVSHPIIIDQYYCDSTKPCPNKTSTVRVSEVAYMNIKGTSATREALRFACSQTVPCQNVVLADIDLTLTSGGTPTTFCENAMVFNAGPVTPIPCVQNYSHLNDQWITAQTIPHKPEYEL